VGRRHLSYLATVVAVFVVMAAPAGAAIQWRLLVGGPSPGSSVESTTGAIALTRAAAAAVRFASRLPDAASAKLMRANFSRDAVVAIFGEFGCRDGSIGVSSIVQRGTTLVVKLVERNPPGMMQCMAIFPTYRLLLVSKSQLKRPYPVRASVTLA
jgi:hypothetical protein